MGKPIVLWVDDYISSFLGLESYLSELPITLRPVGNVQDAVKILNQEKVRLLLFDLILTGEPSTVSRELRRGITLAQLALDKGVRQFIVYTVLASDECKRELESFQASTIERYGTDVRIADFSKATSSVDMLVDAVRFACEVEPQSDSQSENA